MIYDHLSEGHRYRSVHPGLDLAFDYLTGFDPETADGKYELDGERVFAIVQSYVTKPAEVKKYESHLRYVDLQYVIAGEEILYHAALDRLTVTDPYDDVKERILYRGEDSQAIIFKAGEFTILFPQDGHKPACSYKQDSLIKKVVFKIAV